MGKTALAMERSHSQSQSHMNNDSGKLQRRQLLEHSTQPKNAKSNDSNCFSVNFIRYILQTFNVLFFVSIYRIFISSKLTARTHLTNFFCTENSYRE